MVAGDSHVTVTGFEQEIGARISLWTWIAKGKDT